MTTMCSPSGHSALGRHGSSLLDVSAYSPQGCLLVSQSPGSGQTRDLFKRNSSEASLTRGGAFADFRPGSRGAVEARPGSRGATEGRGDIGSLGCTRPRPFGVAGRALTTSQAALNSLPVMEVSRPSSSRGDAEDDDQDVFLREARALIKVRSERSSMRPKCLPVFNPPEPTPLPRSASTGFIRHRRLREDEGGAAKSQKTIDTLPVFQHPPRSPLQSNPSGRHEGSGFAVESTSMEVEARQRQRIKVGAQARMAACYEDLISFLEMSNLSGAYALVFAANGVENLSQLLLLNEDETAALIALCDLDAIDEILLLEALQNARPSQ